ncbi:MAG: class I SAM-dependent methyltransferase [Colwellia sp.]|nr:class I SAM-dependent methyltransferase [Colwellia sp.]
MTNENQEKYSVQEDNPADWFEPLYAESSKNGEGVPWANMKTHPSFRRWLNHNQLSSSKKSALVVGCGMGDDAIDLENLGFQVTAFDVSETAIKFCKERFPDSTVNFIQADLLQEQNQWQRKFDFVLEIYTVQALPPKYETELIQNISSFVAPAGQLLVIAEVSNKERVFENGPPWLLTPQHIDSFVSCGINLKNTVIEQDDSNQSEMETYVTEFSGPVA